MYSIFKITSDSTADYAAEELKKYLRMMMPRCGEVRIAYDPAAQTGFRLGLMRDFGLDTSDAQNVLLDDIVYVDTDEQGGIIAGSNPGALLIAVYRYLRFCGCRWLFPGIDGERIPLIGALPPVRYRKLADHRYRGQCNEGAESQQCMLETIDFTPKVGMNTYMMEFDIPFYYYDSYYQHSYSTVREPEPVTPETVLQWKRQCETEIRKRGLHFHDMGHGWTAESFGLNSTGGWNAADVEIPEEIRPCLAECGGKRELFDGVALTTNICFSNPEARRRVACYIADYAEKQDNVDFLHIWLGDGDTRRYNHCECAACSKKSVSDWYLILLNEADAELTRRGLATHLVFIAYNETFWAPQTEHLNHPERFTMLYAPCYRYYTEGYDREPAPAKALPYQRGVSVMPRDMGVCLGHLQHWKAVWPGDCFCYEYYFWKHQVYDPSGFYLARRIYDDIRALRARGLMGMVEDGSQRSFFPNGFAFYVFAETQFDRERSFEELREDYFRHAYGEDWQQAAEYLEAVREHLDFAYFSGLRSSDPKRGAYYCPAAAQKASDICGIAERFAPVAAAHKKHPVRAVQVSWQLLDHHRVFVSGLAKAVERKALGDNPGAAESFRALQEEFSRREIYLERCYDHYLQMEVLKRIFNP